MPHHYDVTIIGAGHNGLVLEQQVIFGDWGLDFTRAISSS